MRIPRPTWGLAPPLPHRGGAIEALPLLTPKIMGLAQICKVHWKAHVNSVGVYFAYLSAPVNGLASRGQLGIDCFH